MTRKRLSLVPLFIVLLVAMALSALVACGSSPEMASTSPQGGDFDMAYDEAMEMEMAAMEESGAMDDARGFEGDGAGIQVTAVASEPNSQAPQQRLIIRTADMNIVVTDTDQAMTAIAKMANDNGGWVVNSGIYEANEEFKAGNITIRVPSQGFDSALDAIEALSVEVSNLSTSGQDVTEEYVDLSSRLENLEATAERVRAFLDETETVEEALAVNQELSRLEGEIESIKGRMQYLSQSASFSTITVHLSPDALSQPIQVAGWEPQGIAKEAFEALLETLQSLISFLIWVIIYLLPILLLIGLPIWLIGRFVWKRMRRSAESDDTILQRDTNDE